MVLGLSNGLMIHKLRDMRYVVFVFIFGFMGACSSTKNVTGATSLSKKNGTESTVLVQGQVTESRIWCGGARPPEDLVKELATPVSIPNYDLYIREGKVNDINAPILHHVKTDDKGKFSIELSPGTYTVVDINKKDVEVYQEMKKNYGLETNDFGALDLKCYDNFLKRPDFLVKVSPKQGSTMNVNHNYVRQCEWSRIPCVEFKGPLPQ
mgnify:CR=1 FL=1